MEHCPDIEDIAAYVDGEYDGDPAVMAHHLATCAVCAREAAEIELVNMAVRESSVEAEAPAQLIDWIDTRDQATGPWMSRRQALGGMAVAASAFGAVFVMTRGASDRPAMATTLFRDFATLVAADGSLDLRSSDPVQVVNWFNTRVPFEVPDLAGLPDLGVRGGRLCWLLDRRVAALHLGPEDKVACLYVTDAEGLALQDGAGLPKPGEPPALVRDGTASGAFWRDGALAFGLIGKGSEAEIDAIANRLRASA